MQTNKTNQTCKISILTFHCANNYGAVLQAYALQTVLSKYSRDVSILDYRPDIIVQQYIPLFKRLFAGTHIESKGLRFIYHLLLSLINYYFLGSSIKILLFEKFRKECFNLCAFPSAHDSQLSVIVLGSDQIWNPRLTDWDKTYFWSNQTRRCAKVISYAASIGNDKSTPEELNFFRENIKSVDAVSVREETAQKTLSALYDKQITTVLDPTLLLKATDDEWQRFVSTNKYGDYILLYQLAYNPDTLKICRTIAKQRNLKIIEIIVGQLGLRNFHLHKHITSAGPEEFVSLFAHASYVVTSSFHGTAFSLIFNKQFLTVAHPTAGSRMRDLLARIGLSSRIVSSVDDILSEEIDYAAVNGRLDAERHKSFDFIERALGLRD